MRLFLTLTAAVLVIAAPARGQSPEPVTEPEAYVLYSLLVPPEWLHGSKPPILLLSETEVWECHGGRTPPTPEWRPVVDDFVRQNFSVRPLVPSLLRFSVSHTLLSRTELDADDARLKLKYPGTWQHRPGSIEYAAVSAVGFNADKSKAMLYVRLRSQGELYLMEKRDGVWARSPHPSCAWIV